ncbi:MAG TPA: helix-turn-helix domain-containing protein [Candidatus Limnocylindrales bacterium]|nr:helix-turn-helix domain-containing protein [Candidatus Limnocylindrales bacterium]
MDDLLSIGRFARLSGLSVGALRHYDDTGLLAPAEVDRFTGYRRYHRDQLETARAIGRLRDLEVSLETIRAVLATDDPGERQRLLGEQRARVEARLNRLQRIHHVVGQLSQGKEPLVSDSASPTVSAATDLDAADHRRLGKDLFNHVWTLLETADRTAEQTDEMIHAAHASRWHWTVGGEPANRGRGEWQCSRVYAVLGRGEPALWHARRCLALCEEFELGDWDLAAAYEAMARASFVAGDAAAARDWKAKGVAALGDIADPDDREPVEADLATLP